MNKTILLNSDYEISYKELLSIRRNTVEYIERCNLDDGGYFFARVPPSSGMDTYYAVKGLSLLKVNPRNPKAIMNLFLDQMRRAEPGDLVGTFVSVETLYELDLLPEEIKRYAVDQVILRQNSAGGFGTIENLDVEISSELEETYRAVRVLATVGAEFNYDRVIAFVSNHMNPDGGYGNNGRSTLASTYYATEINRLTGIDRSDNTGTILYLKSRETAGVQFIEDLFWLIMSLNNFNEKPVNRSEIIRFILECRRANGGFSRSTVIGIPNLEYTFYALSILHNIGLI